DPTPTKTLTLTDWAVGMGVVTTRMPLDRVETSHSMVIAGCVLPSVLYVQRPRSTARPAVVQAVAGAEAPRLLDGGSIPRAGLPSVRQKVARENGRRAPNRRPAHCAQPAVGSCTAM